MSIKESKPSYTFICDGCSKEKKLSENTLPYLWCHLIIKQHAYDYQGNACADATVAKHLCNDCKKNLNKFFQSNKSKWKCPIDHEGCIENCGSYSCGN